MLVEIIIDETPTSVARKVYTDLLNDYDIDLLDFSFSSKEIVNGKEKIYLFFKNEDNFLDIINAIKNTIINHGITIHSVNNSFLSNLINMIIKTNSLNNFFNVVDADYFEKDIYEMVENSLSIDDVFDRVQNRKTPITPKEKKYILEIVK